MSGQRLSAALDAEPTEARVEAGVEESVYREAIDAFGDVASAIGDLHEQDELLHLIARKICELVDVPRCSVYLRDPSSGLFRGKVGHAAGDAPIKRLVCGTKADGFTREIVETRAPVVIRNARTDPRPVRSAMRAWNVVSMMGVPMVISGTVVGLIFLDSEDQLYEFTRIDGAVASAFADLAAVAISQSRLYNELRSSHETVARQNDVLRRAAALDDKLTSLVLNGCNLREVAEAVTELTRKPCAIHDAEGHAVATAVPDWEEEVLPPRLLEAEFAARPEVAEALSALSGNGGVVGPFPSAGLPHRFLVAPVMVRDDRWGTLVLGERGSRLGGFDMLIGRRTATVIALELSAARRAANAEWNARSSLAGELIRGNRDSEALEGRAQYLGMALHRPHVLCLLTARRDAAEGRFPDARSAAAAFRSVAPGTPVLATEVAEGVAAIVEVPKAESVVAGVQAAKRLAAEVCRDLDAGGNLVASLSTACTGTGDYGRAYDQAREVLRCLESFASGDVLSADDLGAGRLFIANADPTEVERFARETLGGLLDEDVPGYLLATLQCFFDSGRSIRQAALALEVHENTIRHRLGRAEQLTGLAVAADSDAQLSVQLALLVLRLQGRLPAVTED